MVPAHRLARACSAASATRSRSRSSRTSPACRRRSSTIAHQERPELSRSALGAARPGLRARPHVHVAVLDRGLDPAARRDGRAAGVDPPGAAAAGAVRPADGGHLDLAAGRRAGAPRSAARRLAGSPRHLFTTATTAPPGKEVRVTGIGDRLVGAAPRGVGALVRAGRRGPLGLGACGTRLAWAIFGAGLRRRRRVRRRPGSTRPPATCCWCWPPAPACRPTSAPRSARSASCAASGWTAPGGSPGSRTTPPRSPPPPTCPCPTASTEGIAFEHVSFAYPGTDRLVLERRVARRCPPARSSPSSARTAPARPRSSSCWPSCTSRPRGRILVDGAELARMPADEWRERLAGAFQDFFRFELRGPPQRRRRRRAPASTTSRPW